MMTDQDHQGHHPQDAVKFGGLGCLWFIIVLCGIGVVVAD